MEPARFEHDCDLCTYLGQHKQFDLYYCPQGGDPTVIARFDSHPSSYLSDVHSAHMSPPLAEARTRAHKLNLLYEGRRHG